jgi:hypothetical protein
MKKHLSSFLFGCVGLGVGFTLSYVYLVLPARDAKQTTSNQPRVVAHFSKDGQTRFEWRQPLIQPTLPPKVIEK